MEKLTNKEAIERLKCMRLFMQINDKASESKFLEEDYIANSMAVAALEKQIPKEPIEYEDKHYGCPVCGNPVMHKWKKYPTVLNDKKNGLPYCLSCGQALDWGENSKD